MGKRNLFLPMEDNGKLSTSSPKQSAHIRPDRGKSYRSWISLTIISASLVLVALNYFSTAISKQIHDITDTFFTDIKEWPFLTTCSHNGIYVSNGCICDLDYTGKTCSERIQDVDHNPRPKSVLLVLDSFDALNLTHDFASYSRANLAKLLAKEYEFNVTVLYIGSPQEDYNFYSELYRSEGVTLISLPRSSLNFGNAPFEHLAHDTNLFIKSQTEPYSIVYFSASSGAGYYTLLEHHQGLVCSKSKFIVGVDSLWQSAVEQFASGYTSDYLSTEKNTLKLDYVQRKSVELADHVVISSNMLLEALVQEGWSLPAGERRHVIYALSSSEQMETSNQKSIPTKELVYVGRSDSEKELKLFFDVIENLDELISRANVLVTFWISSRPQDFDARSYIESKTAQWKYSYLKWSVLDDSELQLLDYMTVKESGRVAVIPSILDPLGYTGRLLLDAEVPFITTANNAVKELISDQDRSSVISEAAASSLMIAVEKAVKSEALIPKAKETFIQTALKWADLFDVVDKQSPNCIDQYDIEPPSVSVVLTHRNRHELLQFTIKALEAQTYAQFEVILVDDGSDNKKSMSFLEDLSSKWWEERKWKIIREPRRGVGAARNVGVKHSSGRFVLFMDDDDLPKPHWIESLVRTAVNTGAELVTSGHDIFVGPSVPRKLTPIKRYLPIGPAKFVGMIENVFGDSHFAVTRELFAKLGGFSEDIAVGAEDYEFLAKAVMQDSHIESVAEPLTWVRAHHKRLSEEIDVRLGLQNVMQTFADGLAKAPRADQRQFELIKRDYYGVAWDHIAGWETYPAPSYTLGDFDFVTEEFTLPWVIVQETVDVYVSGIEPTVESTYTYSYGWESSSAEIGSETYSYSYQYSDSETMSLSWEYVTETEYLSSGTYFPTLTESGGPETDSGEPQIPTIPTLTVPTGSETEIETQVPGTVSGSTRSSSFSTSKTSPRPSSSKTLSSSRSGVTLTVSSTKTSSRRSQSSTKTPIVTEVEVPSEALYEPLSLPIQFPEVYVTETSGYETFDFPLTFPTEMSIPATITTETLSEILNTDFPLEFPTGSFTYEYDNFTEVETFDFPLDFPSLLTWEESTTIFSPTFSPTGTFTSPSETGIEYTETISGVEPSGTTIYEEPTFSPILCDPPLVNLCGGCYSEDPRDCNFRCPQSRLFATGCAVITRLEPDVIPNSEDPVNITIAGKNLFYDLSTEANADRSISILVNGEPPETIFATGDTSFIVIQLSRLFSISDRNETFEVVVTMNGNNINKEAGSSISSTLNRRTSPLRSGLAYTTKNIQVYAPGPVVLNVNPEFIPREISTLIQIEGRDLLDYPSPMCVFDQTMLSENDSNKILARSANIDGSTITCMTPEFFNAGEINVYVRFDTPALDIPYKSMGVEKYFVPRLFLPAENEEGVLSFMIPDRAPILVKAAFVNNGSMIAVDFDQPIKGIDESGETITLSNQNCEVAFITNPRRPGFGSLSGPLPSNCKIIHFPTNPQRLWLVLNSGWSMAATDIIKPNESIILKENVVTAKDVYSNTASGTITVEYPEKPVVPNVIVNAPGSIPGCGSIPLSFVGTSGQASRKWISGQISFVNNVLSESEKAALTTELDAVVQQIIGNKANPTISAQPLIPGNYEFTVSLTNFIGGRGSATFRVRKFSEIDVPVILFSPKSGDTIKVNLNNVLSATVLPPCAPELLGVAVAFKWSLAESSPNTIEDFPEVDDKSILALPAFTMKPSKQYTYHLVAKYDQENRAFYPFDLNISTKADTMTSSAGSSRVVGSANKLRFNAGIISDGYSPSDIAINKLNSSFYSCTWQCVQQGIDGKIPCIDITTGQDLILEATCNALDVTGKLQPGARYEWQVNVENLDSGSKARSPTTYINLVEGRVPSVEIIVDNDTPSSWDPDFFIDTDIDEETIDSDIDDLTYKWEFPETCNDEDYDGLVLDEDENMLTPMDNPTLKLVPGSYNPTSRYCIKLTVIDPQMTIPGEATYSITIRDRPRYGSCQATMDDEYLDDNGNVINLESFLDYISISCLDWETDELSYPLYYIFEIRDLPDGDWSILSAKDEESNYYSQLSAGEREIRVTVVDAADSPNNPDEDELIIKVSAVTSKAPAMRRLSKRQLQDAEMDKATKALNELLDDFAATGDGSDAQKRITVITGALPNLIASDKEKLLQTMIINFTNKLVDSGNLYVDTAAAAPWLSSLFMQIAGQGYTLGISTLEKLLDSVKNVVFKASSNGKGQNTCFSSNSTRQFIAVTDLILGSLTVAEQQSSQVEQVLESLLPTLETCLARTKACGETAFTARNTYLSRTIAKSTSQRSRYCGFNITGLGSAIKSGVCVSYVCGTKVGTGLYSSTSGFADVDYSQITDLTFRDAKNETELDLKFSGTAYVNVTLPISPAFNSKYDIMSYVVGQQYITGNSSYQPVCAFIKSDNTPSTSGCTLVAIDYVNSQITCQCNHLTDFAVALLPLSIRPKASTSTLPPTISSEVSPTISVIPPSPSSLPTSDNTAAIAGGVAAGAVVIVLLAAGAIFYMKRKKAKQAKSDEEAGKPGDQPRKMESEVPPAGDEIEIVVASPPPPEVPILTAAAELVTTAAMGLIGRRRDPQLLPVYQLPPTYDEHIQKMNGGQRISTSSQSKHASEVPDAVILRMQDDEIAPETDGLRAEEPRTSSNMEQRLSSTSASNHGQDGVHIPNGSDVAAGSQRQSVTEQQEPRISVAPASNNQSQRQSVAVDNKSNEVYETTQLGEQENQAISREQSQQSSNVNENNDVVMEEGAEISYLPENDSPLNNDEINASPRNSSAQ